MTTSRPLTVAVAAAALAIGLAASAAASGGGWLVLGGHNDASGTTTVDNHGRGPALRLETRRGAPPMRVTSHERVARLNADTVDGMHAQQLRTTGFVYRIGGDGDEGPWLIKSFPDLPAGHYLATYHLVVTFDSPQGAYHDLSCWFTTATQPKAGQGSGHQLEPRMIVDGSAYVDGRRPFTFRISSGENYSTIADASDDRFDSRISFIRVAPVRSATTTYQP